MVNTAADVEAQDDEPEDTVDTMKLSFLDRFLSLWILLAMILGTITGIYVPSTRNILNNIKIVDVSLPVFLGLLLMLYPVFCKVKYEELRKTIWTRRTLSYVGFSLLITWILCPMIMAAVAWSTLPDLPNYRVGVLLVGIAPCIAMVLVWNQLAGGDAEFCALLVAVNSVLQLILFPPLVYFYTVIIGGSSQGTVDILIVVKSVLLFLGIPLVTGFITRIIIRYYFRKSVWYDTIFLPLVSPIALIGLIYTIFIIFAMQGIQMINQIGPVFRVTVPLVLYFSIVWIATFYLSSLCKFPIEIAITQSFTCGSNNFELALAVAIAIYGVDSQQALATTIGPLVEVPVLLGLVYLTPYVAKVMYVH